MYTNWEYRSIQLDWEDHRGEYAAAVGLHDQPIYGIDAVLNEAGGHGWELVSFSPRREASNGGNRIVSFLAVFKRPIPE
jgi:hypothetical protein